MAEEYDGVQAQRRGGLYVDAADYAKLEAYLRDECMECDYCRAGARALLTAVCDHDWQPAYDSSGECVGEGCRKCNKFTANRGGKP